MKTISLFNAERKFSIDLLIPTLFIIIIWIVKLAETIFNLEFYKFGILPRRIEGIIGIITSPLLHADFAHLISNSLPLLLLGTALIYFYPSASRKVLTIIYFFTGLLVWIAGRQVYHIGASGLIYGMVGYLFFSGIFRKDNRAIGLALLVTFLYGGLVWGILPGLQNISWESHLFGGINGILCAFIFRNYDPYRKYDWEDEIDEQPASTLEISHDPDRNDF